MDKENVLTRRERQIMDMRRIPMVRQVSWVAVIPQIIVMIAMLVVAVAVAAPENAGLAMFCALGIYFVYSRLLRWLIARDHRRGMRLVKRRQFEAAIPHFEKSPPSV